MFCNKCGKEIKEGSKFCPECGAYQENQPSQPQYNQSAQPQSNQSAPQGMYNNQPVQNYTRPPQYNQQPAFNGNYQSVYNNVPQPAKTNVLSLVGFIMSLVSAVFLCGSLNLPSLIISIVGLNDCKKKGEEGSGFAIAGIVISSIVILLGVLLSILYGSLLLELVSDPEFYFDCYMFLQ